MHVETKFDRSGDFVDVLTSRARRANEALLDLAFVEHDVVRDPQSSERLRGLTE